MSLEIALLVFVAVILHVLLAAICKHGNFLSIAMNNSSRAKYVVEKLISSTDSADTEVSSEPPHTLGFWVLLPKLCLLLNVLQCLQTPFRSLLFRMQMLFRTKDPQVLF